MFGPIPEINVTDFRELVGKKPLIIDVSEPSRFDAMHVAHAINVPYKTLIKSPETYLTKDAYLICETGSLSKKATRKLAKKFNLHWVQGGTLVYARRYSVIRQQKIKEKA
jgi:rhodanese-related sulfurtransferase